ARAPAARPRRQAAATRAADEDLLAHRQALWLQAVLRRLVVPLLLRPGAEAVGLLRIRSAPDQRGRRADGLLLLGPQGVLRPVLRHEGALLSGLAVALAATAALAGATGTWSPCGLSMVETLGRHGGGRRTTLTACVTFVRGA